MNKQVIIEEQGEKAYDYFSKFLKIEENNLEVVKTTTKFNILKIIYYIWDMRDSAYLDRSHLSFPRKRE